MDNIFTMIVLAICLISNVVMLFLNEKNKLNKHNSRRIIVFMVIALVLCVIGEVISILGVKVAIVIYGI